MSIQKWVSEMGLGLDNNKPNPETQNEYGTRRMEQAAKLLAEKPPMQAYGKSSNRVKKLMEAVK